MPEKRTALDPMLTLISYLDPIKHCPSSASASSSTTATAAAAAPSSTLYRTISMTSMIDDRWSIQSSCGTISMTMKMPEQCTSNDQKKHLYLVFDDWNSGYSIRKVCLSRRSGKHLDSGEVSKQPLWSGSGKGAKALPVFMRVPAQRGYPEFFTSAFGTKIMLLLPGASGDITGGIPTIDVQDLTFTTEPAPNLLLFPIYFPVSDDSLFALDMDTFKVLRKPEHGGPWVWQVLAFPPFMMLDATSYCVQPDGCILVSTKQGVTFIFDTKEYVWKLYGRWVFPFTGHGHYDSSMKGFVGLSKDPETLGYLYCCTMASTVTGNTLHPSPDIKCTKAKIYNKDLAEGHVSATLVHMRQGKFCLVECVDKEPRGPRVDEQIMVRGADSMGGGPQCGRFMYCLKTFSLVYDMRGDLKLKHCKNRCYILPREARIGSIRQDPVAFWL